MLFLTPFITDADLELLSPEERSSYGSFESVKAELEAVYEQAGNRDSNVNISVTRARDEAGIEYTELNVQVTGRFVRDGVRYMASGSLAISFDGLLEALEAIFAGGNDA